MLKSIAAATGRPGFGSHSVFDKLSVVPSLYAILIGLLAMPFGAVLGLLGMYGFLSLRMSENQGRRGLLAGVIGIPAGLIIGFIAGSTLGSWLTNGSNENWRGVLGGSAMAVLAALVFGFIALIAGMRIAENRGVTNYAGERAAWGLFYVSLPIAVITGIGGFLFGRWLLN